MQNDLDAGHPQLNIHILGVNAAGLESGNAFITSGRDIPWLQDHDVNGDGLSDVWRSWNVTYRDVVILDAENARVGTFNLTTHDLGVPANYNTLRQMFVDAASVPEPTSLVLLVLGAASLLTRTRGRRKT